MNEEDKKTSSSNALSKFIDSMKGQTILKGVGIGLLALSLAVGTSALVVTLVNVNSSEPLTHTVSFRNYDNALVTTETIKDGEVATDPSITPTKPSDSSNTYSFLGWDKDFATSITEDTTYTAQYSSTPITTYQVRFLNNDGTLVEQKAVRAGETATCDFTPTRSGYSYNSYSFYCWVEEDTNEKSTDYKINGDTTFIANYKSNFVTTSGVVLTPDNETNPTYYSVTGYTGVSPYVYVDATYNNLPISHVAKGAFTGNNIITNFYGTGITTIDDGDSRSEGAFSDCTSLKEIIFDGLTSIGNYAFYDNYYLTSFNSSTLLSVGKNSFEFCFRLQSFVANAVTSIGDEAFLECYDLDTISLTSLTSVGEQAFYYCKSIVSFYLPELVTVSKRAFIDCTSLKNIRMSKATSIEEEAFYNCPSLATIDLNAVKTIGARAFTSCHKLTSASFLAATSIDTMAFYDCDELHTITIPVVTSIGNGAFAQCYSLNTVAINDASLFKYVVSDSKVSLTYENNSGTSFSIPDDAFSGMSNFTTFTYANTSTIDSIGNDAFANTSIAEIPNLSPTCTIESYAFQKCTHLSFINLISASTSLTLGSYAFEGIGSISYLRLPANITIDGISPFFGDTFEKGAVEYLGNVASFTTIADTYKSSYSNYPLFPSKTSVSCSDGTYGF